MKIGDRARFSKTISESDVYMYAGISGDFNPIHINKVKAQESIFGRQIVHGMLGASLISAVIAMQLPGNGTIYMEQDCKFVAPMYIGDTLTASVEVSEIIKREKGIIKLISKVENQEGKVVIEGFSVVKIDPSRLED